MGKMILGDQFSTDGELDEKTTPRDENQEESTTDSDQDENLETEKKEDEEKVEEKKEDENGEDEKDEKEEDEKTDEKPEEEEKQEQEVEKKPNPKPKPMSELTTDEKAALYEKLAPEFTKRTTELAKIKKEGKIPTTPQKDIEDVSKDIASEFGWNEDEAKNLTKAMVKIASSLGYVKKDDIQLHNFENNAQKEIDLFVAENPEFSKINDPNDVRWNALMDEFNLYKTPTNPEMVGKLLRKCKESVFGKKGSDEARVLANIKKNKTAALGSKSGSSSNKVSNKPVVSAETIELYRSMGWSEEYIKDLFS